MNPAIFLTVTALFFSALTWAQRPDPLKDPWRQDGELFTVQISRGNPVRIFVFGREEAKIDPKSTQLTIRRLKPYPGKILTVNKMEDYFSVPEFENIKDENELEIIAISNDKKEAFNFKLKPEQQLVPVNPTKKK